MKLIHFFRDQVLPVLEFVLIAAADWMQSNTLIQIKLKLLQIQCFNTRKWYQTCAEDVVIICNVISNVVNQALSQKLSFLSSCGSLRQWLMFVNATSRSDKKARSFVYEENFCSSNQIGTAYWNRDVLIIISKTRKSLISKL